MLATGTRKSAVAAAGEHELEWFDASELGQLAGDS